MTKDKVTIEEEVNMLSWTRWPLTTLPWAKWPWKRWPWFRVPEPNTLNTVFGARIQVRKYGGVGYPWKDLAKCSSDALILRQGDHSVKIYNQISFLPAFPIVVTLWNGLVYGPWMTLLWTRWPWMTWPWATWLCEFIQKRNIQIYINDLLNITSH